MTVRAPFVRRVDALTGEKAAGASKFIEALREADARIDELEQLHDWQFKVAEALGLTDTVEGVGHVIVVRTVDEAVEFAQHYTKTAVDHESDCPVWCADCEHYELPMSCKRCGGGGCGPGTASGAYGECEWCAGDGRDHSFAYVHVPDTDLGAQLERLQEENASLCCRVQELEAELDEARDLVRQWRETALAALPHVEGGL